MKVLFLDVDGVLNNYPTLRDRRFGPLPIDGLCVERLHRVATTTGCNIVLSSAWRDGEWHERKLDAEFVFEPYFGDWPDFRRINIRHPDGSTKHLRGDDYKGRGSEIAEWLSRHPEITKYAIVDDDSDMLPEQRPFFVRTPPRFGLTEKHAAKLIQILGPVPQHAGDRDELRGIP